MVILAGFISSLREYTKVKPGLQGSQGVERGVDRSKLLQLGEVRNLQLLLVQFHILLRLLVPRQARAPILPLLVTLVPLAAPARRSLLHPGCSPHTPTSLPSPLLSQPSAHARRSDMRTAIL